MSPQEQNMEDYKGLQVQFLAEAEDMFGPKTEYKFVGIFYHNASPRMMHYDTDFLTGERFFKIDLCGKAINDRTDGIFQLSHEVVHLLSPIERGEDEGANNLEEGMAVYFSKLITERETGDHEFCDAAIEKYPNYVKAYQLYLELIKIDENAVKKVRAIRPVIDDIQAGDFAAAGIEVPDDLIQELLGQF
jgi:hypothetical protein